MPFPVDIQFVKAAEQLLGVLFPPSFVVRMVRQNGGEVFAGGDCWQLYPFFDSSDRTRLKRTCNDIVRETKSDRDRPGFPSKAVAIATNGTGDRLVLIAAEDGMLSHEVYWWDHETDALNKVADDFSELQ